MIVALLFLCVVVQGGASQGFTDTENAVGGSCALDRRFNQRCETAYIKTTFSGLCGYTHTYSQEDANNACASKGKQTPAVGYRRDDAGNMEFCCGSQGYCKSGYSKNWGYEHSHKDKDDVDGFLGEVTTKDRGSCSNQCIEAGGADVAYNYHHKSGVCRCYSSSQGKKVWDNLYENTESWTFCKISYYTDSEAENAVGTRYSMGNGDSKTAAQAKAYSEEENAIGAARKTAAQAKAYSEEENALGRNSFYGKDAAGTKDIFPEVNSHTIFWGKDAAQAKAYSEEENAVGTRSGEHMAQAYSEEENAVGTRSGEHMAQAEESVAVVTSGASSFSTATNVCAAVGLAVVVYGSFRFYYNKMME